MKTALIVDDEPLFRRQVVEILERYGLDRIIQAGNGREAVDLALKLEPLLLVIDYAMPQMDGLTACEQITRNHPLPMVLMTGAVDPQTIERARLCGVMSYVVKPFRDEQMYAAVDLAIHHFMELHSLRNEVSVLRDALETRKLIDKAKAILVGKGMTEGEAYRKIQKLSMDKRKSLRSVAEAIVLSDSI